MVNALLTAAFMSSTMVNPYLNLFHHSVTFVILSIVIVLCGTLLRRKKVKQTATPALMLFFYYLVAYGITGNLYRGFLLIFWAPNDPLYNQQWLYFSGILHWLLVVSNPLFEIFLCLERILAVAFPLRYSTRWKQAVCLGAILTFIISTVIYLFAGNLLRVPESTLSSCAFITCATQSSALEYRITSSLVELVAAIALMIIIRWRSMPHMQGRKNNKAILIIVFTSLILEFSPNLIGNVYSALAGGATLPNIIGPYHTTFSVISILISIVSYFNVFSEPKASLSHTWT